MLVASRMRFPLAVGIVGTIAFLAACAPSKPANMSDVCQMRECVCAKDEMFWRVKDQQAVQWNRLGQPYCETGFVLRIREAR